MSQLLGDPAAEPVQHAGEILRAWVRLDQSALRKELEKVSRLCLSPGSPGLEEERLELLKAAIANLDPNPASSRESSWDDHVARVCLSLLVHLAHQP